MRKAKLLFLYFCKALGLFWIARQFTKSRLKILCYHGFELVDEAAFRSKLFIKPDKFEQRLEAIHRLGYRVLRLDEAVSRLYEGTLPTDAVVITVDDGFHSFAKVAVPRLLRYRYPATVYVTTYYVQHPKPIFRLVVQYMFWKSAERQLRLTDVSWSEHLAIDLSDHDQVAKATQDCIDFGDRQCTEEQRQAICEQLGALLGVPYDKILESNILSLMRPEELRELAGANIQVELHTHRHSFPADDRSAAAREITDNRAALALWVRGKKRHFCYPSGLWDQRQWEWLDDLGVSSSTTCLPGWNDKNTPRHALRRFLDGENIHQLEFEAALSGFLDILRSAWLQRCRSCSQCTLARANG